MQAFFDRIAGIALPAKVGILLGVMALMGGGYWYFWYDDMMTEKAQLVQRGEKLEKEKKDYENRKKEYLKYRKEVQDLLEEQQELVKMLPRDDDIEQFIENIQAQVELSGLMKVSSVRDPAVPVEMYERIPIRMAAVGTFHQINRFFKNVGELQRIVNIEDVTFAPDDNKVAALGQPQLLKATFVATTFQFRERGGKKPIGPIKAPPTQLKAGGEK